MEAESCSKPGQQGKAKANEESVAARGAGLRDRGQGSGVEGPGPGERWVLPFQVDRVLCHVVKCAGLD